MVIDFLEFANVAWILVIFSKRREGTHTVLLHDLKEFDDDFA
jgi:hypothetical protein